jgi:hypothetical protein
MADTPAPPPATATPTSSSATNGGGRVKESSWASVPISRSESLMTRNRLTASWVEKFTKAVASYAATANAMGQQGTQEAVQALADHLGAREVAASHIRAILAAVEKNPGGQTVLRASGGLALVVHAMALHVSVDEVQAAGCRLLDEAAEDDNAVQDAIGQCEGIDAILEAMTEHRRVLAVQDAAASALRSLTWAEGNRKTMLRHGAIQDLVEAMRLHPGSALLQEHAVGTIAHTVFGSEDGRKVCGRVGGVQAIVKAMQTYPDAVSLQAQCCLALRNLSWQCKENHVLMQEHDADDQIMMAMIRFPRIPGVQDQALAAISNLMLHDEQMIKKFLFGVDGKASLPTLIFAALHTFSANLSIVRNAQTLLINLCDDNNAGHLTTLRHVASQPNAAKVVLRAVATREVRNVVTAANAAKLMKVLCLVDEFQVDVRSQDGLAAFLACVEQFAEGNAEETCTILEGINSVCSGNDESKALFNQLGGVAKLSALMLQLPSSPLFQERCCMLLDNISNGQFEATAENMSDRPEAMRSVLAAMILYPQSASLQEHACSVMIKVAASSEEDSNELCAAGAKPVVEKARAQHAGNPAVESLANQLLTLLVPTNDGSREGRGVTPRGSSSARLRSRSRTVQTGQRSRSRMDRSKSREKKRNSGGCGPGGLEAVDENSNSDGGVASAPARHAGSKPESSRKGAARRAGGRAPVSSSLTNALDAVAE